MLSNQGQRRFNLLGAPGDIRQSLSHVFFFQVGVNLQNFRSGMSGRYESNYCADSHAQATEARFAPITCGSNVIRVSCIYQSSYRNIITSQAQSLLYLPLLAGVPKLCATRG
jgi:hypothetical protein